MSFCDFKGPVGKCGMWIESGDRCPRHQGKKEKPALKKGIKFSGASKQRTDEGYKTPGIQE